MNHRAMRNVFRRNQRFEIKMNARVLCIASLKLVLFYFTPVTCELFVNQPSSEIDAMVLSQFVENELQCSRLCRKTSNCDTFAVDNGECLLGNGLKLTGSSALGAGVYHRTAESSPVDAVTTTAGYQIFQSQFQQFGSSCYYVATNQVLNWNTAREKCNNHSMHLATVSSASELEYLTDISRAVFNDHTRVWIGGLFENVTWQWVTGEAWAYDNWDDPSIYDFPCLGLWLKPNIAHAQFLDTSCGEALYYICEQDIV